MRVLVNALSVTNASGRHVLLGHLRQLAAWTAGRHEFVVLHHAQNADLREALGDAVAWHECPDYTRGWLWRTVWQTAMLPGLVRRHAADVLFMASGTIAPFAPVPQVSLAMNPWCLVPRIQRTAAARAKARLQRYAYRQAVRRADLLAFISGYIRDAYRDNAGCAEKESVLAYAALSDDILDYAARAAPTAAHEPNRIVCVSAMAPHKGVETVVEAVAILRREHGVEASLRLVGGWPDGAYEARIRAQVERLGLSHGVTFAGHVSREALFAEYAGARVFCLMSWCESFGIPAIEAQAVGTPVVSSNCCAIPEICGAGGMFPDPGDARGTAQALHALLVDNEGWARYSKAARRNAAMFRYEQTAQPLLRLFELTGCR